MPPTPDLRGLLATINGFVSITFPGDRPVSLQIRLRSGQVVKLPLDSAGPAEVGSESGISSGPFSEREETILQVLDEADGEKLTAEELARRAGYPLTSDLRTLLGAMVRRGLIENHRPGYVARQPLPRAAG